MGYVGIRSRWRLANRGGRIVEQLRETLYGNMLFILPTHWDVFCKQAKDCEQTGQRASASDFIQQLVAIHIFIIPQVAWNFRLVARLGIDLDHSIDDKVEAFVLIER